jgi:hypothetical protein
MMTNDDIKNAEKDEKMPKKIRILRDGFSKRVFLQKNNCYHLSIMMTNDDKMMTKNAEKMPYCK